MNALDVATRFTKRLDRLANGWTGSVLGSPRTSHIQFHNEGEVVSIEVTEITQDADPRPCLSDHPGEGRPRYDQIRIAEILSKYASTLAVFAKDEADLRDLGVWYKRGIAGFIVNAREGQRFMVQASAR
jgi:hypothetical protein